jgi:hypothetical protein
MCLPAMCSCDQLLLMELLPLQLLVVLLLRAVLLQRVIEARLPGCIFIHVFRVRVRSAGGTTAGHCDALNASKHRWLRVSRNNVRSTMS